MMSCNHINQVGSVFCSTCGGALDNTHCRCGFVAKVGDIFCSRCGGNLVNPLAGNNPTATDKNRRFDLEQLVQQATQEKQFLESTDKARVTQDDIRKLLTVRRKKF